MYRINPLLIEKCRILRKKGFTLGKIIKAVKLPKVTVYGYIRDIPLPPEVLKRLEIESTKRINEFNIKYRKGKCAPGRVVIRPKGWNRDLIFLAAHFMFDGEVQTHACVYHNRNRALLKQVEMSMNKVFHLPARKWLNKITGVHRISYHYIELADYIRKKIQDLKKYIKTASLKEKQIFLRAFFDDEGSVNFYQKIVRGYQQNLEILKLVQKLLREFNIKSKIDEKYKEIIISRKINLIEFRDKINFSEGIYINPNRKNSIWRRKIEKRDILNKVLGSYQ